MITTFGIVAAGIGLFAYLTWRNDRREPIGMILIAIGGVAIVFGLVNGSPGKNHALPYGDVDVANMLGVPAIILILGYLMVYLFSWFSRQDAAYDVAAIEPEKLLMLLSRIDEPKVRAVMTERLRLEAMERPITPKSYDQIEDASRKAVAAAAQLAAITN